MRALQQFATPFVGSFRELQGMLHLCGGFISGSFLVAFLLRKQWDDLDMDVFVPHVQESYPLKVSLSFFKQKGYRLVQKGDYHPELAGSYIRHVYKLRHWRTLRYVDVIETTAPNAIAVLKHFHSSLVSNGLTARHLLVMFHHWTSQNQSLAPATLAPEIRDKYEARGVQFITNNTDWERPTDLTTSTRRYALPPARMASHSAPVYLEPPTSRTRDPILPNQHVFFALAAYCSFVGLASLACVCKPAARAVYDDRRRRVNVLVSPFVDGKLEDFRTVLHNNRGAITGSLPVRLLADDVHFIPGDLDIAVPAGTNAIGIITFFKYLGYKLVPRADNAERDRLHASLYGSMEWRVGEISTFVRPQDNRRVEIIRSTTPYAVDAVLAHPNTLLQNFITGTLIGCLFPAYTLRGHALACDRGVPNRVVAKQLVKYKRRGFHIHADNSHFDSACGPLCPTRILAMDDPAVCLVRYSEYKGEYVEPSGQLSRSARTVFTLYASISYIRELAKLATICLELAYIAYIERHERVKFNVEPYVPNYASFMELLARTGSVLTGSLVLYTLLANKRMSPGSISIAVPRFKLEAVANYLLDIGYAVCADDRRRALHRALFPGGSTEVESVHMFLRITDGKPQRVDLIHSRTDYAADAVQAYPFTIMHNFISASNIVCLYPWYTFNGISMATRAEVPDRTTAQQLVKYKRWGFELYADNRYWQHACGNRCPLAGHRISDSYVCVQRFSDFTLLDEIFQLNCLPPRTSRDLHMEMEKGQQFRIDMVTKRTQPGSDTDNGRVSKRKRTSARNAAEKNKTDVAQLLDLDAEDDGFHEDEDDEEDENVTVKSTGDPAEDQTTGPVVVVDNTEPDASKESTTESTDKGDDKERKSKSNTSLSKSKGQLVQAKLLKPDGSKGLDWGYTGSINECINVARALASANTDTYAFAKVPANQNWTKMFEVDKDPFFAISVAGTQRPLKVWGVGNVTRTYFFTAGGDAPFSVSANVRLINDNDNKIANNIIAQHTQPRTSALPYPDVQFGKWMAVRYPGDTAMTNEIFDDLYDAREGIKLPKSKMDRYPVKMLKKGDLVLVEATMQRYHPKVNGRPDPKKWNATYSIEFIALLADSPPPTTVAATMCDDELVISF
ncbi:hypothetical protein AURDEDRAFT_163053 [Auricularia subglabra TFB-10046 SS5]|nr:hypothetical protein AURDEDRAFT_163053 [Auricularia subglabra TFB-10046 SS5]